MEFSQHLIPNESVALAIIWIQLGLFLVWLIWLAWYFFSDLSALRQAQNVNVESFLQPPGQDRAIFSSVEPKDLKGSHWPRNKILREHLSSIVTSGRSGRPIEVTGLVSNTISKYTANTSWLRSFLSLFIILGLLGTLLGLASTLGHLSTLGPGGEQITNESLAEGLKVLLSRLGGAFAPSIWGVSLTVAGVLLFSFYTQIAAVPLKLTVEGLTLKQWAPTLAKKGVDEAALMRENIKAAQQIGAAAESIRENIDKLVVTFDQSLPNVVESLASSVNQISEKFANDATELADDVRKASKTLRALTTATENLNTFSETFKTSVESLYPFSDASKLRELYEALLERSTTIIESNGSFQEQVHQQLEVIAANESRLEHAVAHFHQLVSDSASKIADEVGGTSTAARDAFDRLSVQNETVIRELVEQVGKPVTDTLQPMPGTLTRIATELQHINTPLEGVKNSIEQSSFAVVKFADERLARVDDKLIAQVRNLEVLAERIDALSSKFEDIGARIDSFNTKASQFGSTVASFAAKSDGMSEKFADFDRKADKLIASAGRTSPRYNGPTPPAEKDGFFRKIRSKFFG